jgi:hypothetical protein
MSSIASLLHSMCAYPTIPLSQKRTFVPTRPTPVSGIHSSPLPIDPVFHPFALYNYQEEGAAAAAEQVV